MDIENLRNTNNWFNFQGFYSWIAAQLEYETFVEVGVWKGHSISYLADLLRSRKVKIYAVDLFEKSYQLPAYQSEVDIITRLYERNLEATNTRHLISDIRDWSHKAADRFADDSIDFVFIDADHKYKSVRRDILAWYPKVKKNGIIAGHDYHGGGPGVIEAVDEILGDNKKIASGNVWYHRK